MTPESFAKHFHLLADAPNSIQILKKMILQLAVQGKLVLQNPLDEPASKLLQRIKAEKKKLIASGEIKKSKPLPDVTEQKIPFNIPESWKWVKIEDVSGIEIGKRMKGGARQDGIISLGGEHLKPDGRIDYSVPRFITEEFFQRLSFGRVELNDTLMVKDGATTGKTALVESLPPNNKAAVNEHVFIIRAYFPLEKQLLFHFIRLLADFYIKTQVKGIIGGVRRGVVSNMLFPLPPLDEQRRIVESIDQLMALCDELDARHQKRTQKRITLNTSCLNDLTSADEDSVQNARKRISDNFDLLYECPENVSELRPAILQLAVRGKLVRQNPEDDPASVLLKKIEAEKEKLIKEGKIRKQRPQPAISSKDVPYELPKGWAWVRLGQLIHVSSGSALTSWKMENGDIPVFGGNGITGYHNCFNVHRPTIVIGRVGFYCGSIHLTPQKAWVTDNAFITVFPEKWLFLPFLVWLLRATDLRQNDSATAQPVISGRKIYPLLVQLPPIAEQKRIVAKVDQLMALCDELAAKLKQSQSAAEKLMGSVVNEFTTASPWNSKVEEKNGKRNNFNTTNRA